MKINKNIIIGILLLIIIGGGVYSCNNMNKRKAELQEYKNLQTALNDSLDIYRNEYDELVAEKKSIQYDLKELETINTNLTVNQKRLIERINKSNKKNDIISAAYVELEISYNKLKASLGNYDGIGQTITFIDSTKNIQYEFIVSNVRPADTNKVTELNIKKLVIPNRQYIEFKWEDHKREGYPVSFQITNTNDLIRVIDADSYIIPEISKEEIKSNFWQKAKAWLKRSWAYTVIVPIAIAWGFFMGSGA